MAELTGVRKSAVLLLSLDQDEAAEVLKRLPPEQKEAVLLVICNGMSHKDASLVLGCAEKTVTWRIFEAKKKLKEWYGHG